MDRVWEQTVIRQNMLEKFVPMLTVWVEKSMREEEFRKASVVHAHLAYMYRNTSLEAFDAQAAHTLVVRASAVPSPSFFIIFSGIQASLHVCPTACICSEILASIPKYESFIMIKMDLLP